ncbi:hypothetical protein DPMN_109063 [Dreissena polymorpha]|uniref:Uncharacterized protein n=1 Tax=Dreissena polymorpha TaxID=45954 RepID=A0A9D4KA22_DREPO|nr:hypothetical protein DPMN_109063 [Dreissena polymorpha]
MVNQVISKEFRTEDTEFWTEDQVEDDEEDTEYRSCHRQTAFHVWQRINWNELLFAILINYTLPAIKTIQNCPKYKLLLLLKTCDKQLGIVNFG